MSEKAFDDVLNTIEGKKRNIRGTDMMAAIKNMPQNAFLAAVSENISGLARKSHTSMILSKTAMAFFVAGENNEILRLNLKLIADTPETARNIQQIVNGFIALARLKHTEENRELKMPKKKKHKEGVLELKMLENLKVRQDRNVLIFELEYPSRHLIEMADYWGDHY
jgi:hypothetical protein